MVKPKVNNIKKPLMVAGGIVLALIAFNFIRNTVSGGYSYGDAQGSPAAQAQVQIWIETLLAAFFDVGTDSDAVFSVFNQIANGKQFLQLLNSFGKRPYAGGYMPSFLYPDMSLVQQIREEMSGYEIDELNQILNSKGINFNF
jgi:hypothetical protein